MWEKIEWFGDIAKRSLESPTNPNNGRPPTSDTIKGLILYNFLIIYL